MEGSNITDQNVVVVRDLSYTYPRAAKPALVRVSLDIRAGEIFGLLGPSGAGKSTLQRIITRQIRRFSEGTVYVLGQDVKSWDQSLYERVGVGFELPNHYLRLSGRENLEFFASLYQSSTRDPAALLDMVGLGDAADQRVEKYSKGMQVRLNFARAVLHDPEVLFLDEPTTGLDPTSSAVLKEVIAGLRAQGKTIILTTHNMYDADELCDRVGFIAHGKLAVLDSPQNLRFAHGERTVTVMLDDGQKKRFALEALGQNADFLASLNTGPIRSIHSQEASLDDVFRIVTGTELHTDGTK